MLSNTFVFTEDMRTLNELFVSNGYELRLVGGCVRDALLGKVPKDIDMATTATPDQMIAMCDSKVRPIATGYDHGTITMCVGDEKYEVTTLRVDAETDGRHAEVEYTTNWEVDAGRRDFTMNSMSMDFEGNVFDPFGGQDDIEKKIIRFVGDPVQRIEEDVLRILRFYRMGAKITWPHYDRPSRTAIRKFLQADEKALAPVSVERIWSELKMIFTSTDAFEVAENDGLFDMLIPGFGYTAPVVPDNTPNFVSPVSLIAAMVRHNVDQFCDMYCVSNDERKQMKFIADNSFCMNEMDRIIDKLIDGTPVEWITDILYMREKYELLDKVRNTKVPEFPVRGQDLIDVGYKSGPAIGFMLKGMREDWVKSGYTMSKNQLMMDM